MSEEKKVIPLTTLPEGEPGVIWEIAGGHNVSRRLAALGVRKGKQIRKISTMLLRGPVTVQVGTARISIGYGMASKIMVDLPAGRQGQKR